MSNSPVRRAVRAAAQVAAATSLVAAFAVQAHAQTPVTKDQPPAGGGMGGGRGMGGAQQMTMMMEGITLNDMQKAKIDSISADFMTKQRAMPRPEPGTPMTDESRAARQKMMADRTAAIKAVLTAEQAKTFDDNMSKMRQGGGRPPAGR